MDPRKLRACAVLWLWGCASAPGPQAAPDGAEPVIEADAAPAREASDRQEGPSADAAPPVADAGVDAFTADDIAAFQPCPTTGPCRVLPLGDSLTFGVGSAGAGGGYRVPLFRRALAAKQSLTFVGSLSNGPDAVDGVPFPRGHEGYRGYAIDPGGGREGLSPIVEPVVMAAQPHVVLLLTGTNDVGATVIDAPHAPDRLGALIERVVKAAPAALIVVAQIPPSMDDATNKRIEAFNAALPALVQGRSHVLLVDAYAALTSQASYKSTLMFNEFHPNDAGYARIADRWYEALSPFLR